MRQKITISLIVLACASVLFVRCADLSVSAGGGSSETVNARLRITDSTLSIRIPEKPGETSKFFI